MLSSQCHFREQAIPKKLVAITPKDAASMVEVFIDVDGLDIITNIEQQ